MLVTQQRVLRRFWYPVMPISHLSNGPQPFELLGQKLVLWLTDAGKPAAAADRCCHRSAQLSGGEVVAGNIRCPYHGWSFNAAGRCVQVPQLMKQAIPRTYQVPAYHCAGRYDYVWVCLADPLDQIPEIAEASDPQFRQIPQFYEVWNCSGLRLMENSFDNAHPHFVHHQTFGDQQNPVPPKFESFTDWERGLQITYRLPVLNPDLQKQNLNMTEGATVRISEGTWFLPFTRKLKITYPNGLTHIIVTAATPIDDRRSQVVQFCLRNDTEAEARAEAVIAFDRAVTLEDKAILENTDYDTPLDLSQEQHMATDKPGIVMRHKLAALLQAQGEIEQRRELTASSTRG